MKDYLLNKGLDKMHLDLDIVELLKIIQGFRVMKKVLFKQDELDLLQY